MTPAIRAEGRPARAGRWGLAGLLLVLAGVVSTVALPSEAALAPEAALAMRKGLAATQFQEWDVAVEQFERARRFAPADPTVLFDLALASDRQGNRDLIAAARYRAYLAVAPEGDAAARVRARAEALAAQAGDRLGLLLESAHAAAGLLAYGRDRRLVDILAIEAIASPFAAERTLAGIVDPAARIEALAALAEAQPDWDGAAPALAQAQDLASGVGRVKATVDGGGTVALDLVGQREPVLARIAGALAAIGDSEGALRTANLIGSDKRLRAAALHVLARHQAEAGDVAGAAGSASIAGADDPFGADAPFGAGRGRAYLAIVIALAGDGRADEAARVAAYLGAADAAENRAAQAVLAALRGDYADALARAEAMLPGRVRTDALVAIGGLTARAGAAQWRRVAEAAYWSALAQAFLAQPALADPVAFLKSDPVAESMAEARRMFPGMFETEDQRVSLDGRCTLPVAAATALAAALVDLERGALVWSRLPAAPAAR